MSAISEKSFKQIRIIQAALHNAIKRGYAGSTDFSVTDGFIYSNLHNANGMCGALGDNDDIMIALNLSVSDDYDGTHIKNTNDEPDDPRFSIQDLADEVDELVKQGRNGIAKIVNANNDRFLKLRQVTDDMDNAYREI